MALYLRHQEERYQWGVWKTDESVEELLSLLPDGGRYEGELARFKALHRQQEWLAVRVLLCQLLGEEKRISYTLEGKPFIPDGSYSISISHTRGYVAVIVSPVAEVGIDIEQYGQRIHKVTHKYLRPDEVPSVYEGEDTWSLLLHWCAKEVMIKCIDATGIDLLEHLRVEPFAVREHGAFRAKEYRTERRQDFLIHYRLHPDFVMTWQCRGERLFRAR